jgi:hypothetical protein
MPGVSAAAVAAVKCAAEGAWHEPPHPQSNACVPVAALTFDALLSIEADALGPRSDVPAPPHVIVVRVPMPMSDSSNGSYAEQPRHQMVTRPTRARTARMSGETRRITLKVLASDPGCSGGRRSVVRPRATGSVRVTHGCAFTLPFGELVRERRAKH